MNLVHTILYALVGGILPAVLWLVFWLEEDKKRPEPRGLIFGTFILGMFGTVLVLPIERFALNLFPGGGAATFISWAIIEEVIKFGAAWAALHSIQDDEPLDPLIYMIVAALGFIALENTLFIANPLLQSDIAGGVLTGQLRFIGASLLHIVSSATIGASLALSFYKPYATRVKSALVGFALAVFFHTAFNLFIVRENGLGTFFIFATVWSGIAILFLIFEKVKTISAPALSPVESTNQ